MRVTGGTAKQFLTINQPDSTYRWIYLVNISGDVPTGKYGRGSYLTAEQFNLKKNLALYDTGSGTPANGEEWGPTASSWKLSKSRPGFLVYGMNDTTTSGSEKTVVLQQPPGEILVYNATGSAIAAASSGTATLYGGTAGSEASLSLTVTVYNRSSVSWASAKYGVADLINGQAYINPIQT